MSATIKNLEVYKTYTDRQEKSNVLAFTNSYHVTSDSNFLNTDNYDYPNGNPIETDKSRNIEIENWDELNVDLTTYRFNCKLLYLEIVFNNKRWHAEAYVLSDKAFQCSSQWKEITT